MPRQTDMGEVLTLRETRTPTDCLKGIGLDAIAGWAYAGDALGGQATAKPVIATDWIRDLHAAHHLVASTSCRLA